MCERSLDQEDAYEEARARAGDGGSPSQLKNPVGMHVGGLRNPDLKVPDLPGWHEWAAKVKADRAAGRIKMTHIKPDGTTVRHPRLRGVA